MAVGAFLGLAAIISAESLRKTREVCPEILQACKTNEVDEHGDPHWPLTQEEFKCINEKLRKIQDITFLLVADCGQ